MNISDSIQKQLDYLGEKDNIETRLTRIENQMEKFFNIVVSSKSDTTTTKFIQTLSRISNELLKEINQVKHSNRLREEFTEQLEQAKKSEREYMRSEIEKHLLLNGLKEELVEEVKKEMLEKVRKELMDN